MCVFFLGVLCPVCPSVSGLYSVSAGAGVSVRCVQHSWVCTHTQTRAHTHACVCVCVCVCVLLTCYVYVIRMVVLSKLAAEASNQ